MNSGVHYIAPLDEAVLRRHIYAPHLGTPAFLNLPGLNELTEYNDDDQ